MDDWINRLGQSMLFYTGWWGIWLFNRGHDVYTAIAAFLQRSWHGVRRAHQDEVLLFPDRNQYPWTMKEEDWDAHQGQAPVLRFLPSSNHFAGPPTVIQDRMNLRFLDIVTVELKRRRGAAARPDKQAVWDLSPMFYELSWSPDHAPSLLEIVLVAALMENQFFSVKELMDNWVLEVFRTDTTTELYALSTTPFTQWNEMPTAAVEG